MDKNLKNVVKFSILILTIFIFLLLTFVYFYKYSTINTYNYVLLVLIGLTIIITMGFVVTGSMFFFTYQKKRLFKPLEWALMIGLKVTMPFLIQMSRILKGDKDVLRKVYVEVNNIYVESKNKKYLPKDILILLPHCLQNSDCGYKVTNDINLCVGCGRCNIGEIKKLAQEKGLNLKVVTGGTAARNIVSKDKPKLIISVACERDLTSGMTDVGIIPVIGILNLRPNGPCYNTSVDMAEFDRKLEGLIK